MIRKPVVRTMTSSAAPKVASRISNSYFFFRSTAKPGVLIKTHATIMPHVIKTRLKQTLPPLVSPASSISTKVPPPVLPVGCREMPNPQQGSEIFIIFYDHSPALHDRLYGPVLPCVSFPIPDEGRQPAVLFLPKIMQSGRASCRERVCRSGEISVA